MGMQIYLVQPRDLESEQDRVTLADVVASHQGYILMATSYGSLIVALDERYVSAIQAHPLVNFVGGITLNPNAPGAAALQRLFANNLARQLNNRQQPADYEYPPSYRPLRWRTREDE